MQLKIYFVIALSTILASCAHQPAPIRSTASAEGNYLQQMQSYLDKGNGASFCRVGLAGDLITCSCGTQEIVWERDSGFPSKKVNAIIELLTSKGYEIKTALNMDRNYEVLLQRKIK